MPRIAASGRRYPKDLDKVRAAFERLTRRRLGGLVFGAVAVRGTRRYLSRAGKASLEFASGFPTAWRQVYSQPEFYLEWKRKLWMLFDGAAYSKPLNNGAIVPIPGEEFAWFFRLSWPGRTHNGGHLRV